MMALNSGLTCSSAFDIRNLQFGMNTNSAREVGFMPVEILHVDTAGSRDLYNHRSPIEKSKCAKLLRDYFKAMCMSHGGRLSKWEGDGGFALFPSRTEKEVGASVRAGATFLEHLPSQNAQTAKYLGWKSFPRQVRIKAHRGEVYVSSVAGLDSADSQHFDDFLKFEKKFAPRCDELFITQKLYDALVEGSKARFQLFQKVVIAGALRTRLHRLRHLPVARTEDIFKRGDEVATIAPADWNYLRQQITTHFANITARNHITKGLIAMLSAGGSKKKGRLFDSSDLLELTLDALYSYLRVVFRDWHFHVSYWRCGSKEGSDVLRMASYRYPEGELTNPKKRVMVITETKYKVCECWVKKEPVVTPCVNEARIQNQWVDFDEQQQARRRALDSALQIPVYCVNPGAPKEMLGVLSMDGDRPDTFLPEEVSLWRDPMVGFLANLALAEKMRQRGA
jgi:hypothetical protein